MLHCRWCLRTLPRRRKLLLGKASLLLLNLLLGETSLLLLLHLLLREASLLLRQGLLEVLRLKLRAWLLGWKLRKEGRVRSRGLWLLLGSLQSRLRFDGLECWDGLWRWCRLYTRSWLSLGGFERRREQRQLCQGACQGRLRWSSGACRWRGLCALFRWLQIPRIVIEPAGAFFPRRGGRQRGGPGIRAASRTGFLIFLFERLRVDNITGLHRRRGPAFSRVVSQRSTGPGEESALRPIAIFSLIAFPTSKADIP